MRKIITDKKRVPFKKVVLFNKEIETFKDGIEIDFDFIDENSQGSNTLNVVEVSHIYDDKLNPTSYKIRYELSNGEELIEYVEEAYFANSIAK